MRKALNPKGSLALKTLALALAAATAIAIVPATGSAAGRQEVGPPRGGAPGGNHLRTLTETPPSLSRFSESVTPRVSGEAERKAAMGSTTSSRTTLCMSRAP